METARNSFWAPTGEYVYINPKTPCEPRKMKPSCWNYTYAPDLKAYGNHNLNSERLCHGQAFWQNSKTLQIYQPIEGYDVFPDGITNPNLIFPHYFDIRVPRTADEI